MTGWRARLGMGLLMLAALLAHAHATAGLPNTPLALLVFHGSAALCDAALLLACPALLHGRLCDDTETLLLASVIGNAAGWALYMAYAPPFLYNACMGVLTLAQGLRLLYVDNDDADYLGLHLVRGTDFVGAQPYFTKAHQ
jgi:hypothetical protein